MYPSSRQPIVRPAVKSTVRPQIGHTLLELLVALAILTVLMATAIPSLAGIIARSQGDALTSATFRQLTATRALAVDQRKNMTLCGTSNKTTCIPTAYDYLVVFHDANRNKRIDKKEKIEYLFDRPKVNGYINWNVNGIIFRANGSANSGSMIYCPKSGKAREKKRVTISFAGRIYIARPGKNGIVKTASGKPIQC